MTLSNEAALSIREFARAILQGASPEADGLRAECDEQGGFLVPESFTVIRKIKASAGYRRHVRALKARGVWTGGRVSVRTRTATYDPAREIIAAADKYKLRARK